MQPETQKEMKCWLEFQAAGNFLGKVPRYNPRRAFAAKLFVSAP